MPVNISEINKGLIIICGVVLFALVLLIFFIVLYRKRHNFFLQEQELRQLQFEQTMLQSKLEIQEQTFTRISEEIHDNIGQMLSLVRLNINTLGSAPDEEKINSTDDLLGKAIADLRQLSHNLNAGHIVEAGLVASFQKLLQSLEHTGRFSTHFETGATEYFVPADKLIIYYRIVQEVINNILKHAKATKVSLALTGEDILEGITVSDNGRGFDAAQMLSSAGGLGIRNMQERARQAGAMLVVDSKPMEGTTVRIICQATK